MLILSLIRINNSARAIELLVSVFDFNADSVLGPVSSASTKDYTINNGGARYGQSNLVKATTFVIALALV